MRSLSIGRAVQPQTPPGSASATTKSRMFSYSSEFGRGSIRRRSAKRAMIAAIAGTSARRAVR
jgi:hypothetical protein